MRFRIRVTLPDGCSFLEDGIFTDRFLAVEYVLHRWGPWLKFSIEPVPAHQGAAA
jgi:hypothetical protein